MKLEEVKRIFEEKAIGGFRLLLFGLGKSHDNADIFPVEVNSDLQNAFLFLLEHPAPKEQLQDGGFLWLDKTLDKEGDEMPECEFAENHFHMLLNADTHYQTPRRAVQHIKNCPKCRKRLEQYHDILLEPNNLDERQAFRIRETINRLVQHFSFVGKKVDCKTARKFLPQLADNELPILIPTPISVHVEQCPQCERGLEMIRQLRLDSQQLGEIAQLYSETDNYKQLRGSVDQLQFEGITEEKLKELRKILCCVTEYKESGIVTHYQFCRDAAGNKQARDKGHLYDNWPVIIRVFEHGKPKFRPKPIFKLKRKTGCFKGGGAI